MFNNLEETYTQLIEALNYLEESGEDPTPQGGDVFLTTKTGHVLWNRWEKKFEFRNFNE